MSFTPTATGASTPLDYLRSLLGNAAGSASGTGQAGTVPTTGVGVTADVGNAPEATKAAVVSSMMASIDAFMPAKSDDDVDVMVATATAKLKETMNKSQAAQIKVTEEMKREQSQQAEKKYKDAEQKIQDANYAKTHASIWDKIKLAFEYIGALVSILAGILTMVAGVVTGGAAFVGGALLIASGVLMLTMAVDETVQQATGQGMFQMMFTQIAKDAGLDPNSGEGAALVKWGSFAFQTTLMVMSLITGVVGGIVAPEATVSDIVEGASAIMDAARGGEDVEEGAEEAVSLTSQIQQTVEDLQSGINSLADKASSKIQDIGDAVKSFAKDPSKLAEKAGEVGQRIAAKAEDMGQSVADNARSIAQAPGKIADKVQGMARSVADTVQDIAEDPSLLIDMGKGFAKETAGDLKAAVKEKPVKFVQQVKDTTTSIVGTTGDIAQAQASEVASQDTSDADSLRADAKAFEAMNKVLDEFIDIALGQLKKSSQQLNAVLDSVLDSKNDLASSLNQFKFHA